MGKKFTAHYSSLLHADCLLSSIVTTELKTTIFKALTAFAPGYLADRPSRAGHLCQSGGSVAVEMAEDVLPTSPLTLQ